MTPRHGPTDAQGSAVVSPHWRASVVGRDVLAAGGNAVDASLATNAMLWACYPHMCGVGGDVWLLYYDAKTRRLHCLNGSGAAPQLATPQEFTRRGYSQIPVKGSQSLAVPGAAAGWDEASRRFGSMPVHELLRPAAAAARSGVEITTKLAGWMTNDAELLTNDPTLASVFTANGAPREAGSLLRQPDLADSLDRLADAGLADFYRGDLAAEIIRGVAAADGLIGEQDLKTHASTWVDPVSTRFDGVDVVTTPPSSQGIAALEMLNLLSVIEGGTAHPGSVEMLLAFLEAQRIAYTDRDRYLGDPAHVDVPIGKLLSLDRARGLAMGTVDLVDVPATPLEGDTVYLAAVDREGNACSVIQSIYHPFGSGFVPPGTGVVMANRGSYFSLDEARPDVVAPGKRPVHTLMASMAMKQGRPWLLFGTMGGEGQPQTNVQVLFRILGGASPAEAVSAPRVLAGQILPDVAGDIVHAEEDLGDGVVHALRRHGHEVRIVPRHDEMMGHAHAIVIDDGAVQCGTDPRSDGTNPRVAAGTP